MSRNSKIIRAVAISAVKHFASSASRVGASAVLIHVCLSALLLALPAVSTHGAVLGKLNVLSAVGQPFHAELDVAVRDRKELDTVGARLASADAYRQAGLQYPAIDGLKFTVARRSSGAPFITITTRRPVNEPVMDLLIELAWSSGRVSRGYTALMDPPAYNVAGAAPEDAAVADASSPSVVDVTAVSVTDPGVPVALPPNVGEQKSAPATGQGFARVAKRNASGRTHATHAARSVAERVRLMEEQAAAGNKRLADAKARIAELEKTSEQQQRLLALQAETAEGLQQSPVNGSTPSAQAAVLQTNGSAPAQIIRTAQGTGSQPPADATSQRARQPARPNIPGPAARRPDLLATILGEPMYLAGGGSLVLLGALVWIRLRKRPAQN